MKKLIVFLSLMSFSLLAEANGGLCNFYCVYYYYANSGGVQTNVTPVLIKVDSIENSTELVKKAKNHCSSTITEKSYPVGSITYGPSGSISETDEIFPNANCIKL